MDKLRKELAAKKLKKLQTDNKSDIILEPKPVKSSGKKPKNLKQLKQDQEEDKNIRTFFKILITLPTEDHRQTLERFGSDPKASWNRKRLFSKIITIIPKEFYQDLAELYIAQDKKDLDDFYDYFVATPSVAVAIKRKQEISDKEFDLTESKEFEKKKEIARLKKINKQLFGDDDTDDEYIGELPQQGPKLRTKLVGPNGELVDIPEYKNNSKNIVNDNIYKNCVYNRFSMPWINGIVNNTFIALPDGGIIDSKSNLNKYIFTGKHQRIREENEVIWYLVNKNFSPLMCNYYSHLRVQDGNVLTAFTTNQREQLNFMVAYETTRGFIIQDEEIFHAEQEYEKKRSSSLKEKILIFLDSPITSKVESFGVDKLSNTLNDIAPDITDYGIYKPGYSKTDTTYIVKAIKTIVEETITVREFLEKLGGVVVFLTTKLGYDIFKKRVRQEYYLPEILVNLSTAEKLPEIFDDPRVTEESKDYNAIFLKGELNYFVLNQAQMIYYIEHVSERHQNIFFRSSYDTREIKEKIPAWKSACVNKNDIIDIPDDQIIYYKEDDKVYCLVIKQVLEQISTGEIPINPYTNNILKTDFLKRFKELYSLKIKKDDIIPPITILTTPNTPQEVIIAPGLFKMIVKNIYDCEKELTGEQCPSIENPPDKSNDSDDSGDSDDDNLSSLFSPSSKKDNGGNICEYCKKECQGIESEYKTKIVEESGFKTIYFCCCSCFEEYDNWPKIKSKKRKKNKKDGKKGGRNSIKERQKR